ELRGSRAGRRDHSAIGKFQAKDHCIHKEDLRVLGFPSWGQTGRGEVQGIEPDGAHNRAGRGGATPGAPTCAWWRSTKPFRDAFVREAATPELPIGRIRSAFASLSVASCKPTR